MKRLAEAAVSLKHHREMAGPGRGKKQPLKQRAQSGNRRVYLVNRIPRDWPDVLERMKAESLPPCAKPYVLPASRA